MPRDSRGILVFWRQKSLVDHPFIPEISAQSDPPPFQTAQFRQISTHASKCQTTVVQILLFVHV